MALSTRAEKLIATFNDPVALDTVSNALIRFNSGEKVFLLTEFIAIVERDYADVLMMAKYHELIFRTYTIDELRDATWLCG
jgi:hypothetical protein